MADINISGESKDGKASHYEKMFWWVIVVVVVLLIIMLYRCTIA